MAVALRSWPWASKSTAGKSTAIPITARIDFLKTGLGLMSAITGGNATVTFDGALDLGFYQHPVHLEQRLSR